MTKNAIPKGVLPDPNPRIPDGVVDIDGFGLGRYFSDHFDGQGRIWFLPYDPAKDEYGPAKPVCYSPHPTTK